MGSQTCFEVLSSSEEETIRLGAKLGEVLSDGDVVLLQGDLGAGKTRFTKGVAESLGVAADVVSPTFNIVLEYVGRIPLYHFDLYRLEDEEQLEDIDFYYLVDDSSNGAALIEWADRFPDAMPQDRIEVDISKVSEDERCISFLACGQHAEEVISRLRWSTC